MSVDDVVGRCRVVPKGYPTSESEKESDIWLGSWAVGQPVVVVAGCRGSSFSGQICCSELTQLARLAVHCLSPCRH